MTKKPAIPRELKLFVASMFLIIIGIALVALVVEMAFGPA